MKQIGVIGAGTMGSGIAQKIAMEGGVVTVIDINEQALVKGRQLMDDIFQESMERKLMTAEKVEDIRQSITFSTRPEDLANADFVIEAVFEDKAVKVEIFSLLEKILRPDAVIATNTSSFQVDDLAEGLSHPERLIGLHFFYHPVKNRLLEIIPGEKTSRETLSKARRLCAMMGKVDILCKDSPGFVVNRFFVPWLNESVRLLAEKKASIAEIEATAKEFFKLGMGPFELMNVTGVPIAVHAANGLASVLGDFYLPHKELVAMAQKGLWCWQESGEIVKNPYVFHMLLGVTMAVTATLVDQGCATALDIDLGARVGLRWPRGPVTLFNRMSREERAQVIGVFKERYPNYPLPSSYTEDTVFPLPTVVDQQEERHRCLVLSRPDHANALNEELITHLGKAVEKYKNAPSIIIKGKGKNFAAGADITFFIKNIEKGNIDRIVDFTKKAQAVLGTLEGLPGKVHAVVDGFSLGGGAEIMLTTKIVICTPRALIGFPETGIGIYPGLGGTYRLTQKVGVGLSKYLIGTGKLLSGREALVVGLADYCMEPQHITSEWIATLQFGDKKELTEKWSAIETFMNNHSLDVLLTQEFKQDWQVKIQRKLKQKAPIALRRAWELIEKSENCDYKEVQALEMARLPEIFATADALRGLKSVGKGRPEFTGS